MTLGLFSHAPLAAKNVVRDDDLVYFLLASLATAHRAYVAPLEEAPFALFHFCPFVIPRRLLGYEIIISSLVFPPSGAKSDIGDPDEANSIILRIISTTGIVLITKLHV